MSLNQGIVLIGVVVAIALVLKILKGAVKAFLCVVILIVGLTLFNKLGIKEEVTEFVEDFSESENYNFDW